MKRIFLILALLLALSGIGQAEDYAMIGLAWDVDAGEFGLEAQGWQDIGKGFFIGEQVQGPTGEAKTGDVAGGVGVGPGYWVINNGRLRVGVIGQLASVFVPDENGLNDKYGGQTGLSVTYRLPPNPIAQEITFIGRRSFLPDGLSQTNVMLGVSYKL